MLIFQLWYEKFLSLFPPEVQWVVSLIVVISILMSFWVLIKFNWMYILILVVLVPFVVPAFKDTFNDIYQVYLYVWQKTGIDMKINPL